ncbi:MAG TPA: hypothetical protein VI756_11475, partial [Blastocatellia bacterium]
MDEERIDLTDIDQLDSEIGHYAIVQQMGSELAALSWRGFQGMGRGAAVVKLFDYWNDSTEAAIKTEIEYQSASEPRLQRLLQDTEGPLYVRDYRPESEYIVVIVGREMRRIFQVPAKRAGLPEPLIAEASRTVSVFERM